MTKKIEQAIPGHPVGEFKEEQLKSVREKEIKENLKLIEDLNKIKVPLSVTVFKGGSSWSIRNIAFWQAMKDRDEQVIKFMYDYLKTPGQ